MRRIDRLALVACALAALLVAIATDELLDAPRSEPGVVALAVGVAAILGGFVGGAMRTATTAGVVAAALSSLLVRAPSPWMDLGPFGAGSITKMPILVLPLSATVAVYVALVVSAARRRSRVGRRDSAELSNRSDR